MTGHHFAAAASTDNARWQRGRGKCNNAAMNTGVAKR